MARKYELTADGRREIPLNHETAGRLIVEEARAMREEISRLRQDCTWQPIETAPKDGGVKIGYADGVSFHMLWVSAERFRQQLPMCPQTETGGWVAHAYGFLCFAGSGTVIVVRPTHWMPVPAPPETETKP